MGNINDSLTFRLFARPSFLGGAGRILDLGSTLQNYNRNTTTEEADRKAIKSDWCMVGRDLGAALNIYGQEKQD
jgi:hypothetical protein